METFALSDDRGFTLIEMLVALSVLSLAALALIRLEGATLRTTADLRTRTLGQVVTRNLAVETLTDPSAPALGTTSGQVVNGGLTWRWSKASERTGDDRLARVTISVSDTTGRRAGSLVVVRPVQ
jgi:general secretion pathway protein I